jgi:putative membrane protein insertion efficiency factor
MQWLAGLPARAAIFCVRFYQRGISPLLGSNCRFEPTCSEYTLQAIRKYGAVRGIVRGALRILRCHPFSRGGFDPP